MDFPKLNAPFFKDVLCLYSMADPNLLAHIFLRCCSTVRSCTGGPTLNFASLIFFYLFHSCISCGLSVFFYCTILTISVCEIPTSRLSLYPSRSSSPMCMHSNVHPPILYYSKGTRRFVHQPGMCSSFLSPRSSSNLATGNFLGIRVALDKRHRPGSNLVPNT